MPKPKPKQLQTISVAELDTVIGGRLIPNKGPDQALVLGMQQLIKTIAEVGQALSTGNQAQSQQTMQMMQQLMERRQQGGGGGGPRR